MFYNYLIFNMVTLSLRILLKYCVSHRETIRFTPGNFLFQTGKLFVSNRDETIRLKPASLLLYILQEKGSRRRIRHKKRN